LTPEYLPSYLGDRKPKKQVTPTDGSSPIVSLAAVEKEHILTVYRQSNQNKAKTAKLLKIGLNTLRRKLEKYDI
jgi:transcriptional regulator with PAS, ATPase and Fis domain